MPFDRRPSDREVPAGLAPAFAGRQALSGVWADLFDCEQRLKRALLDYPVPIEADVALIGLLFDLVRREVDENLPLYVCRRCSDRPNPHCACGGKGWLSHRQAAVPGAVKRRCVCEDNSSPPRD